MAHFCRVLLIEDMACRLVASTQRTMIDAYDLDLHDFNLSERSAVPCASEQHLAVLVPSFPLWRTPSLSLPKYCHPSSYPKRSIPSPPVVIPPSTPPSPTTLQATPTLTPIPPSTPGMSSPSHVPTHPLRLALNARASCRGILTQTLRPEILSMSMGIAVPVIPR